MGGNMVALHTIFTKLLLITLLCTICCANNTTDYNTTQQEYDQLSHNINTLSCSKSTRDYLFSTEGDISLFSLNELTFVAQELSRLTSINKNPFSTYACLIKNPFFLSFLEKKLSIALNYLNNKKAPNTPIIQKHLSIIDNDLFNLAQELGINKMSLSDYTISELRALSTLCCYHIRYYHFINFYFATTNNSETNTDLCSLIDKYEHLREILTLALSTKERIKNYLSITSYYV